MGRSLKKGPYVDPSLQRRVDKSKESKARSPIKTWSRRTTITPEFAEPERVTPEFA